MQNQVEIPKISIVVPIYGVEKYLAECVDSILNQTFKDIEIILVDDGSKDRCPQMIDEYASKDSRVVAVHQPNGGYGRAVNHGIEVARGEYIGIIESDDWIEPTMYEELYDKAIHTGADVVKSDFYFHWSNHREDKIAHHFPKKYADKTICPRELGDRYIFSAQLCVWSSLYRRQFLQQEGILFLEAPGASYQDVAFNFKLLSRVDKFHFLDKPLVHYRQDNENASVKSTGKVYAIFDEYDSVQAFLKEKSLWKQPIIGYFLHVQGIHWMWHLNRLSASRHAQALFISRLQQELARLAQEIPDFDDAFSSIYPHAFLLCLNKKPRMVRFLYLNLQKYCRFVSDRCYARVKILGIRILKCRIN
jgi:glycosyltransferase involved in cell wall biosynthesis